MSRRTRVPYPESRFNFVYETVTLYGPPFQDGSTIKAICNFPRNLPIPPIRPHNAVHATSANLHIHGLGSSRFARRY